MPQSENKKIAVILSTDAANVISELATDYYIWAVNTVANRTTLNKLQSEVTTIPFDEGDFPAQLFDCYVETIIEHHPCWEEMLVVGLSDVEEIRDNLKLFPPFELLSSKYGLRIVTKHGSP